MDLKFEITKTLHHVFPELMEFPWLPINAPSQNGRIESHETVPEKTKNLSTCIACGLHLGRSKTVMPRGMPESKILFVGDFPSDDDDRTGIAFSGAVGELLDKMILAINLQPAEVCLAHLTHCRPPGKMDVTERESLICPVLHTEADFLRHPRLAVFALGERSAQYFSKSRSHLSALRGQTLHWNEIRVFASHHPRDLINSQEKKKETWTDLKNAIRFLDSRR